MALRIRVPSLGTGETTPLAYARPTSDVTDGSWTNELGSQTNLYASIDEEVRDDADYIQSIRVGVGGTDTCEFSLTSLTDPESSSDHSVVYVARAENAGYGTLTVYLVEGTTVRASWTDTLTSSYAEYSHALSAAEADSITDYSNLRLRFTASEP